MRRDSVVIQHDKKDCGVACLLMILRYYGINASYSDVRRSLDISNNGISLKDLSIISRMYGLEAKAFRANSEKVFNVNMRRYFPCIALVSNEANMEHYVVIYGWTRNSVIIGDPAVGKRKLKFDDFCKVWSGYMLTFAHVPPIRKKKRKNVEDKACYRYMFSVLKKHKIKLLIILFLAILSAALGSLVSMYVKVIVDKIVPYQDELRFNRITVIFLIMIFLGAWIGYIRNKASNVIDAEIGKTIVNDFTSHLFKLPLSFFTLCEDGDIVTRLKDIEKIRNLYVNVVFSYTYDIIMIFVVGIIIAIYNRVLLIIVVIPCLFLCGFIRYANRDLQVSMTTYVKKNSLVMSSILDELRNISVIKSFSCENIFEEKNNTNVAELYNEYLKYVNKTGKCNSIIQLIKGIANIVLLCAGTCFVFNNTITIGELILCNTLVMYLWEPIINMASLQASVVMGKIAFDRINDVFGGYEEDVERNKACNCDIEGSVELKKVSFSYHNNIMIFKDADLIIKPHCITTLIGVSGSGKSSIAKMIVRICKPNEGNILIDDRNQDSISVVELRKSIIYVEQETKLFNMSIYNNLKLFDSEICDDELFELCEKVGLNDLFNDLPLGWNTIVMESATNLSGGQKQLIALVRALIRHPKVLILDEITNGMDEITEERIMTLLDGLKKDMTIFCITHKQKVVEHSDFVYRINQQKIELVVEEDVEGVLN